MPYRANTKSEETDARAAEAGSGDLVVPFVVLWLVSLVRVAWVLMSRGTFGVQDTLAALALFVLPALLVRGAPGPR